MGIGVAIRQSSALLAQVGGGGREGLNPLLTRTSNKFSKLLTGKSHMLSKMFIFYILQLMKQISRGEHINSLPLVSSRQHHDHVIVILICQKRTEIQAA